MKPRKNERGAVLLTTLMVMSIMAALAIAVIDDVRFAVKRANNIQSYAQADWYALAGEDFARSYLSNTLANAPEQQLNALLTTAQPIVLPIEGGAISMSVRDGTQCLSVNDAQTRKEFRQLLEVLGWDTISAARFTSIVADWSDVDSNRLPDGAEDYTYLGVTPAYRTANTTFSSIMELRALAEMSEEKYQVLRPFLCARPNDKASKININTLTLEQAPLLAAILGGNDYYDVALKLINERPSEGYPNLETLSAHPLLTELTLKNANTDSLGFTPNYVWVETDIYYLEAHRTVILEFEFSGNNAKRSFGRYTPEARRPILEPTPL